MRIYLLLAVAPFLLGSNPAYADRWRVQPNASLETRYDDNVRFVREDAQAGFSNAINAAVRATRSSEASDAGIYLGLGGTRYPDYSDLDNSRGFAGLDLGYQLERQRFRFGARFESLSTLYSEVATTGLVQVNSQQNSWQVNPGWSYDLSERSALDLAVTYLDVSYDDDSDVPFSGYRVGSVKLGGKYSVTERFELNGSVGYGRYEAQRVTNQYDNVDVFLGASYQHSERSSFTLKVGLRSTEQTVDGPNGRRLTDGSSGPVYNLTYFRDFESGGGIRLEARRELAPSGSAQVLDTTGLLADLSLPLSRRWGIGVTADGYRNRSPSGEQGLEDRTYASVAPRLAFEIDESWRLSAGYRFRWQERQEVPGEAISNAVFLTLNWTRPWDL